MYSLFDRKGRVQVLFEAYRAHKQECMKALNPNANHRIGFYLDMQRKNHEMIHEIEDIIKESKFKDGNFQPHLRIETALEQLLIFREEFSHRITPIAKYQLHHINKSVCA